MFVELTNLTDSPGKTPTQVAIYNKTIDPGESIRLPAELVDAKIRSLETAGLISIGSLPSWYAALKAKKGRTLSAEEQAKRVISPPGKKIMSLSLVEDVPALDDRIDIEPRKRRSGE